MITAKEARERTSPLCNQAVEELKDIEARILVAMQNGEYSVAISRPLHDQTIRELIKLGYNLEEAVPDGCDPRYSYWIKIKWDR